MRPYALLALSLMLSGCGYNTWYNAPFTTGSDPNQPVGTSENMRRVMGEAANTTPLTPEPGDVWPGPIKPPPTLQDLENQSGQQPVQPLPPIGSSSPPSSPLPMPGVPSSAPSTSLPAASAVTGVTTGPRPGQVVQTSKGQGVTTGGTSNYQTITTPGGGQAIVVPNGNGTSTIIHPDGTVETVPTPK